MSQGQHTDSWGAQIVALGALTVPPDQFWPRYLAVVRGAVGAATADLYARDTGQPDGAAWQPVAGAAQPFDAHVTPALLQAARSEGIGVGQGVALALIPATDAGREVALLVTFPPQARADGRLHRLAALAAVPLVYERGRTARLASRDALRLSQALGLVGNLVDAQGFDAATTVIVNRLAELFACEQVYLTWRRVGGQRLVAVSHGDLPEQRSSQAAQIEELAQEALTQQSEVLFPARDSDRAVALAAARFAESARPGHLITLPMIDFAPDGQLIEHGALCLTRRAQPFTEAEQWALRLFVELAAQILADKALAKRKLPLRLWHEIVRSSPRLLQVKTLPGRVLLGGAGALALVLLVLPVPYSVSATAVLKTEAVAFVGAPFNGYIQGSTLQLGAEVQAGDALLTMATDELTLERETRLAELAQANRDVEINRSLGKLPEMQVAKSRAEEIKSQVVLLDARIAAANVVAPMAGVVVDGEPAKRLGQAVSRGDMLVTIADIAGLYVEAVVSERDLNLINSGAGATLTLLANPDARFDLTVAQAIPAARQQDGENVFPVRMAGPVQPAPWWLPGMTGVVKIDTGYAPLAWVISRRLIDYLRLQLWL